jgi:hypothetical protein
VTAETGARNEEGFPGSTVRNVLEDARILKFQDFGFEER